MTAAEFKALFPEFTKADDTLVESRLLWAEYRTPAGIWGDLQLQGIAWLTAHFLVSLPSAKDMRKGAPVGDSIYLAERKRLNVLVSAGYRIAGIPPELE